ncbi:hypothetical protein KORDIASMS9_03051 [Kordia sp. SMS9]|uniref:hypothetical protein n=1 Tax=Kordia sp. SMS9 TaxID=2282170 RepID=UPI000E1096CE|nr:hypothetical protein [Kordia sp. SMS9]AXG70805.1 hypothetical protein KORDIASMS9_03051 [Kordia sp. SMS9]
MKKQQLTNLRLVKATISSLNAQAVTGGDLLTNDPCPLPNPDETVTGCSQFAKCDSKQICTATGCRIQNDDQMPVG